MHAPKPEDRQPALPDLHHVAFGNQRLDALDLGGVAFRSDSLRSCLDDTLSAFFGKQLVNVIE